MGESPSALAGPGEMRARCRVFDWSQTPLGPPASWSSTLRAIVQTVLALPTPALLLWGRSLVALYNDAYAALIGSRHPGMLGRPVLEAWHEQREQVLAIVERVWAGEGVLVEDFELAAPDGMRAWASGSHAPVRDEHGDVAGVLVTLFETTRFWRAQQRQEEIEARQEFLLRLDAELRPLSSATEVLDRACRALAEHLKVERVYYAEAFEDDGYVEVRTEYVTAPLATMKGRYDYLDFAPAFAILRAGQPLVVSDITQMAGLRAKGVASAERLGVRASVAAPLLKQGRLVWVLSVGSELHRDWTEAEVALVVEVGERTWGEAERARTESALRESEAKANLANRAKDEFLATLGHELRTPLAAVLLWARLLSSRTVLPDDLPRALDAICKGAEAQGRLIDDLLDLSRLTSGKLLLSSSPTAVEGVARAAVELIRADAQVKGVRVELVLETELGVAVLDRHRLQQVLLNLLSNAVKFTHAGGEATLTMRRRDGWLEADVVDSGIGIEPALMPHLFERFRQGESGLAREHQGLGIGLALSRQLMELHGGTITAHSEGAGRGALFRVRLPWVDASDQANGAALPVDEQPRSLSGISVLLVEDDASTRSALEWTLSYAGATVAVASSGPEALEMMEARHGGGSPRFDVIVSDLGLPGMSGYDLIRVIDERARARGEVPLPACAVTAHARDIDTRRAIDAGFDMCLVKPLVPESLIEAVADLHQVAEAAP